jgi:hypothetical protein
MLDKILKVDSLLINIMERLYKMKKEKKEENWLIFMGVIICTKYSLDKI